MTSTVQRTKSMLSDIKAKLRVETDQEKRHRLAIWGEELNSLLLSLMDREPPMKFCKCCGKEKSTDDFGFSETKYRTKKGKVKKIRVRRNKCKKCMLRPRKRVGTGKEDFNWIF